MAYINTTDTYQNQTDEYESPEEFVSMVRAVHGDAAADELECRSDGVVDSEGTYVLAPLTQSYEFSANGRVLGFFQGQTQEEAQDVFARKAGYLSWEDMVERAEEFGGNTVEVRELG